jgi:hypothetical protein
MKDVAPVEMITSKIYLIRGQKVMLDRDLSELYGVETRVLKQAVKRNVSRFPSDFMFRLSQEEQESLRSQFVTLKRGQHFDRIRFVPLASQCLRQFRHKSGCPLFGLDVPKAHAVDTGAPLVGTNKIIGMTEDVRPIDLVIQGMEATGRLLLGLAVQLPLQCPDALRGC